MIIIMIVCNPSGVLFNYFYQVLANMKNKLFQPARTEVSTRRITSP